VAVLADGYVLATVMSLHRLDCVKIEERLLLRAIGCTQVNTSLVAPWCCGVVCCCANVPTDFNAVTTAPRKSALQVGSHHENRN
jgi:hypothetical protein